MNPPANFTSKDMEVVICFGDYGLLNRLKMLYFLVLGRTVRFAGPAIRNFSAKDAVWHQ